MKYCTYSSFEWKFRKDKLHFSQKTPPKSPGILGLSLLHRLVWLLHKVAKRILVLYICVSSWMLTQESRDLYQAETNLIVATSWANWLFSLKMVQVENKSSFRVEVVVILWICSAFNKSYFCLNLRLITWLMSQQPKPDTDVELLCWDMLSLTRVYMVSHKSQSCPVMPLQRWSIGKPRY